MLLHTEVSQRYEDLQKRFEALKTQASAQLAEGGKLYQTVCFYLLVYFSMYLLYLLILLIYLSLRITQSWIDFADVGPYPHHTFQQP